MKRQRDLRNALADQRRRAHRAAADRGQDENVRLAGMLGAVRRRSLDVQLVPILDVDLDPRPTSA